MFQPILPFFVYPLDNLHFFLTCHKWCERPRSRIVQLASGDARTIIKKMLFAKLRCSLPGGSASLSPNEAEPLDLDSQARAWEPVIFSAVSARVLYTAGERGRSHDRKKHHFCDAADAPVVSLLATS